MVAKTERNQIAMAKAKIAAPNFIANKDASDCQSLDIDATTIADMTAVGT